MGYNPNDLIAVALAEVGYLEKKTNEQLDSKTANAGYNNFTKYARDMDNIPGFYNGKKQGAYWCDMFVDWCFVKAFGVEAAKKLLFQPNKSSGAGCKYSANYYRKAGRLYSSPKVGDQIFFGKKGSESHTGIVYKVTSDTVYTIEGNTRATSGVIANGGGVFLKAYARTDKNIAGYGRPAYDTEPKPKEENTVTIELTVLKRGSQGEQVETLQRLLSTYGYDLGSKNPFDGKFGEKTETAVLKFQKARNITQDGEVGKETWTELLKG